MQVADVDAWIEHARRSPDERGRNAAEKRFSFQKLSRSEHAPSSTNQGAAAATASMHAALAQTDVPRTLLGVIGTIERRVPRPGVQLTGSMGFRASLLHELGALPDGDPAASAVRADIERLFPSSDVDVAVTVHDAAALPAAQLAIVLAVCGAKRALDDTLFRAGADVPSPLQHADWEEDWRSPFSDPEACQECRSNSCVIVAAEEPGTVVRVDVPLIPGTRARMRHTPLAVSLNTSIDAGFTLVRLRMCVRGADGARVMVPLLDVSLSVGKPRPGNAVRLRGCPVMAPSAKEVARHLADLAADPDADPAKAERRAAQADAARESRALFMSRRRHVVR
jgi:hypothetical protein